MHVCAFVYDVCVREKVIDRERERESFLSVRGSMFLFLAAKNLGSTGTDVVQLCLYVYILCVCVCPQELFPVWVSGVWSSVPTMLVL